jgi:hypothetical protein
MDLIAQATLWIIPVDYTCGLIHKDNPPEYLRFSLHYKLPFGKSLGIPQGLGCGY